MPISTWPARRSATAQAGILTAKARPNPSLSVGGGWTNSPESPVVFHFDPAITLETAGKRGWRILESEKLAEAARVQVAETAWRVRSRVRAAWLDYVMALRSLDVLRNERDVRAEAAAILEKRLSVGEAARPDVSVARTALISVEVEAKAAETTVAESGAALASAIGLPSLPAVDAQALPATPASLPLAEVQKAGLLNRADIRRSLLEYAAAEARLRLEIANQYPDIQLSPGYGFDEGHHKINSARPSPSRCSTATAAPSPKPRPAAPKRRRASMPCRRRPSAKWRSRSRGYQGGSGGTCRRRRAARAHSAGARDRHAPRGRGRRRRPARAGGSARRKRGGGAGAPGRHAARPERARRTGGCRSAAPGSRARFAGSGNQTMKRVLKFALCAVDRRGGRRGAPLVLPGAPGRDLASQAESDQPIGSASGVSHGAGGETIVKFTAEKQQLLDIRTEPVAAVTKPRETVAYGRLEEDPSRSFVLRAPVSGAVARASRPQDGRRSARPCADGTVVGCHRTAPRPGRSHHARRPPGFRQGGSRIGQGRARRRTGGSGSRQDVERR